LNKDFLQGLKIALGCLLLCPEPADIYCLMEQIRDRLLLRSSTSAATGIAQKTVALSGLRKMPVLIPPLPEQHRIVAKVDQLMALCDELEASLTRSQADGEKLMQSVVVGCYPQPVISQKMFNGSEKTYPHKIIFQESI